MSTEKQQKMEHSIRQLIDFIGNEHANTVAGMVKPHFVACDCEAQTLTMSYPAQGWEGNGIGMIHGGIVATMLDSTAGILAIHLTGSHPVTVSMQVSYLRPTPLEGDIFVRATVTKAGRRLLHVLAESWAQGAPDKLLSTAACVFIN